jgi:hypothetical protein
MIAAFSLQTRDSNASSTLYPIKRETGQTKRSYVCSFGIGASVAPSVAGQQFKLWSVDYAYGAGVAVYLGDQKTNTYVRATGTEKDTGTAMLTLYTGVITSKTSIASYGVGTEFTWNDASELDKTSGTGRYTYYAGMQMEVLDTASIGATGTGHIKFSVLES